MASDVNKCDSENVNKENREGYDPELDFFSSNFDPLKALETEGIQAPIPDAKMYDNIAKYESVYSCKISVKKKVVETPVPGCSDVLQRFQEHQRKFLRKYLVIGELCK